LVAVSLLVLFLAFVDFSSMYGLTPDLRLGMSSVPWLNRRKSEYSVIETGTLQGRVAVVTGGNSGIGKVTAKHLARGGATVVLTSRSQTRGEEAKQEIIQQIKDETGENADVRVLLLDLADIKNVERFGADFSALLFPNAKINYLILNAGAFMRGNVSQTEDGFEWMFGAHHVGHFLLFKVLQTFVDPHARVVVTSSALMARSESINWDTLEQGSASGITADMAYAQSKLANVLFARELQKRHPNLIVSVNHPGLVRTPILGEQSICERIPGFCFEPEEGAFANLLGCTGNNVKGAFILPRGSVADWTRDIPRNCQNDTLSEALWSWTEKAIARKIKQRKSQ
jgi:NAD(P)-dependent dehydrogenase (short-subunit alcohol dehydrogenase family)